MKKKLFIFFTFLLCVIQINAQKKFYYPAGTKSNDTKNKHQKEDRSKDEYQYKNNFYSALKQKSLENYDQAVKYFEKCIKLEGKEAAAYYELSRIYFTQEKISESLKNSKIAYNLSPKNKWYALFYAENLFSNKHYYEAVRVYKHLIKQDNKNEDYYLELAICYLYKNDLKSAIKTYNSLENIIGLNHYTTTQKYKIYIDLKDFKNAAKELELFLKENPHDIQIYEMLSDCYILDNNFDKAFETLKKLSEINPGSAAVHLTLSDFYLQNGNIPEYQKELKIAFKSNKLEAKSKLRKIIPLLNPIYENNFEDIDFLLELSKIFVDHHPNDEMSNYIYADLLRLTKDIDNSITFYKKVVEINSNQKDAWIDLLFLELQKNLIQDLITDSETALELFPTNPTFYYLNGLAYFYNKEYNKTIETLDIGVKFLFDNPPLSSEMYSVLGNTYNELEDYNNSDKSYDLALQYLPENVTVLNNYAYYLSLRGQHLEKAKKMSKKTIELFPEEANYLDTYAWILYKLKDYETAKVFMMKAIALAESKTFYKHLSDILTELGEFDEAEKYKLKAKEVDSE